MTFPWGHRATPFWRATAGEKLRFDPSPGEGGTVRGERVKFPVRGGKAALGFRSREWFQVLEWIGRQSGHQARQAEFHALPHGIRHGQSGLLCRLAQILKQRSEGTASG